MPMKKFNKIFGIKAVVLLLGLCVYHDAIAERLPRNRRQARKTVAGVWMMVQETEEGEAQVGSSSYKIYHKDGTYLYIVNSFEGQFTVWHEGTWDVDRRGNIIENATWRNDQMKDTERVKSVMTCDMNGEDRMVLGWRDAAHFIHYELYARVSH